MSHKSRWVRVVGGGLAFQGPCLITNILFYPHDTDQKTKIYDGRDAVSGKFFLEIHAQYFENISINLGEGVKFDVGIFITAEHSDDTVTIIFTPE